MCSVRQDVLKNFAKFTERHRFRSLFLNRRPQPATLLKKRYFDTGAFL